MRIARKARLGYDDFLYVAQQTRRKLGLRRVLKQRRLPQLLTEAELKRRREFYDRMAELRAKPPLTPGPFPSAEEMIREDRER